MTSGYDTRPARLAAALARVLRGLRADLALLRLRSRRAAAEAAYLASVREAERLRSHLRAVIAVAEGGLETAA